MLQFLDLMFAANQKVFYCVLKTLGSVRSAFTCLFRIPDDCLKKCRVIGLNASNVYRWEIEASGRYQIYFSFIVMKIINF